MKNLKIFLWFLVASVLFSCGNDDNKFTGSPIDTMAIETITGTVSTDTNFALLGQTINFTATLPQGFRDTVQDTVTVEASTLTLGGSLRRGTVDILPGHDSATGEITVGGGGGGFDLTFDLALTGIKLKKEVPGKHYLIKSNTITVASGNSSVPAENDSKLQIRVSWENLTNPNIIRAKVVRPSGIVTSLNPEGSPLTSRYYFVSNSQLINQNGNPTPEGPSYGYTEGVYKIKIGVDSTVDLVSDPVNLKYRVTVRFPNKDVEVFNGVYQNLSGTSGYKDVLQFTKTGFGDNAQYTNFINLNP